MRDINQIQSKNEVNITGKLISVTPRSGKTGAGVPYESVSMIVRVDQNIEGKQQVSEIPVSIFASQFTSSGKQNPLLDNVQRVKEMKTAQNVGIDAADTIRLTKANLQENSYIAKSGQFFDGWQIRGAFAGTGGENAKQIASFNVEIFIIDMHDEVNSEGDTTGRLIIKGGIVQYAGKLDVVEFIVEDPSKVDYLQRTLEIQNTVRVSGRIRVTSEEQETSTATSSWGEVIPDSTPRVVRELIITGGSEGPYDEEFSYNPSDIKKAFNERKAIIEQKQVEAKQGTNKPAAKPTGKYDWE